jgi:autotransporter translocation and assembly factor TamB
MTRRHLAITSSIILAVLGLAAFSLTTQPGRDLLAHGISWLVSSPEQRVTLSGLDIDRRGSIFAEHVQVEDARGVWIRARHIAIAPKWRHVLAGDFALQTIRAAHVQLARLPQASSSPSAPPDLEIPPVTVEAITLEELRLEAPVAGSPLRAAIQASVRWQAPLWQAELLVQDLEGDGILTAQGHGNAQEAMLQARLTEERGALHRLLTNATGPITMQLTASGPLHAWRGQITLHLADLAAANADFQMEGDRRLHVHAEMHAGEALPDWAREPLRAEATLVWDARGIKVPHLTLAHPVVTVTAQGRMDGSRGAWNATVNATQDEFTAAWSGSLHHDAQGASCAGQAHVQWTQGRDPIFAEAGGDIHVTWDGPWETRWDVTATLASSGPWRGHLELAGPALAPQGTLRLRLVERPPLPLVLTRLLGAAPSVSAQWAVAEGTLHLRKLHLEAPLSAQGEMQVAAHGITTHVDMRLAPQALDLTPQGGQARLEGTWPHDITAAFHLPRVDLAPTGAAPGLGDLRGRVRWQQPRITLEATATAHGIPLKAAVQGAYTSTALRVDTGRLEAGPNQLTCSGTWDPQTARLTGQAQLHAPDLGSVSRWLGASLQGSLSADTTVRTQKDTRRITAHGHGQVDGAGWTSGAMEFSGELQDSRLEARLSLKGPQIGTISLDSTLLTLAGPLDELTAELRAQANTNTVRATVRTHQGFPPKRIEVSTLSGRILGLALSQTTALRLTLGKEEISWSPWQLQLGSTRFTAQGRVGQTLDARVGIHGSLAPIPGLAGLVNQRLAGEVNATATLSGPSSDPRVHVQAVAQAVRYEHLQWGILFQHGRGRVETTADGMVLALQGQDAHNGTARFTGRWNLKDTARIQGQLAAFTLMDTDTAQVAASGAIELLWQKAGRITADLEIPKAHIRLPRNLTTIPRLDVEEVPPAAAASQASAAAPLALDVQLRTTAPATVQGHGLASAWDARLHVTGNTAHPALDGALRLRQGTWQFLGRRFDLTQGRIHFPEPDRPFVDLTARATAPGIETTARILGPVDALHLDLTSTPTLPTEEILARTLFGRALRQISPFQALRLAQTAASLSNPNGAGGSLAALEALEAKIRGTGLDVGTDAQDNPTIGIEREIGDYHIRAERSLGGGDSTSVEVQITPNLGVRTEIGDDSRQGAGVQWSMDY